LMIDQEYIKRIKHHCNGGEENQEAPVPIIVEDEEPVFKRTAKSSSPLKINKMQKSKTLNRGALAIKAKKFSYHNLYEPKSAGLGVKKIYSHPHKSNKVSI